MRIVCIAAFMIGARAFAQISDSDSKARIDSMVTTEMLKAKAIGVAIGIVKDGKIFYNKGYGTKELNTHQPIDSLTNFHVASVSKLFVATAIMQLVERGKIDVNAKLLDYIKVDKVKDQRYANITIQHMLTHTSGIPDTDDYDWNKPKYDSLALGNYCRKYMKTKKLRFEPGTQFEYSNVAFNMLGHVIEIITKQSFEDYEYEQVLSKAGLSYSNFEYLKIDPARRSSPHEIQLRKVRVSKIYPYNREHSPSGTLNSCTYDMCQWILEMLKIYDDKTNSQKALLSNATLTDMWTAKHTSFEPGDYVGFAWWVDKSPMGLYVSSTGADHGYKCMLDIYPEQKLGVIMLINGEYPQGSLLDVPEYSARLLSGKLKAK
ncbi:MAG: serine hydrolase domain-containing protein [Bacteroidota bacterium]